MLSFGQCYGCIYEGEFCPADCSKELKNNIVHNKPCWAKLTIPSLQFFLSNTPKKELLRLRGAAMEAVKRNE